MRRSLPILVLLFSWLCANGALLDIAQVVAWTKMCARYTQTMSLPEAVTKTLDPQKPCELCVAIIKARAASEHPKTPAAAPLSLEKIHLACVPTSPVLIAPDAGLWPDQEDRIAPSRNYPVPAPPPRGVAVIA